MKLVIALNEMMSWTQ